MTDFSQVLSENQGILDEAGITAGPRRNMFLAQLGHESGFQPVDERPSQYASSKSPYHGRGYIQLTGEQNYKTYGDMIGVDLVNNPEMAKDPTTALKIAAKYWSANNLNDKADAGDYNGISAAIGGQGYHGHDSRVAWLQRINSADTGAEDAATLVAKAQTPAERRKAQFAIDAQEAKKKDLFASNPGTAAAIMAQGDVKPSTTSGELFSQANEAAFQSQNIRIRQIPGEIRNQAVADAKEKNGIDIQAMMDEELRKNATVQYSGGQRLNAAPTELNYSDEAKNAAFDKVMRQAMESNPDFKPSIKNSLDIRKATGFQISKLQKEYQDSEEAATFTQSLAGTAGSIVGFMRDPVNLAAMLGTAPLGPAGFGAKAALGRAAVNMASEVPVQALLQQENKAVGLPSGIGEASKNIAAVGVGSLGLDFFVQGMAKGVMRGLNGGPGSQLKVAEALKTGKAGDTTAPIQERVSDVAGTRLEDHVDAIKEAPMADTSMGRHSFIEKLDTADTQANMNKPVQVVPDNSPTYTKPLKPETVETVTRATEDFTDGEKAHFKNESDAWDEFQRKTASGTEEDAARVKAKPEESIPAREQVYADTNARMDKVHAAMDVPEYASRADTEFDAFVTRSAANIDYSILKTTDDITTISSRIERDTATLANWDQVVDNPELKAHQKSDVARQHISQRLEDQKVQLKNRESELATLTRDKEAHVSRGTETGQGTQMIKTQDELGNVVERPASEVIDEINRERSALAEFADCIKTGGKTV